MKFNIDVIDLNLPAVSANLAEFCERLSGKRIPDANFRDADGGLVSNGMVIARTGLDEHYAVCFKHKGQWKIFSRLPSYDPSVLAVKDKFLSFTDTRRIEAEQERKETLARMEREREEESRKIREANMRARKNSIAAAHIINEYHQHVGLQTGPPPVEKDDEIRELMKKPFNDLMTNR